MGRHETATPWHINRYDKRLRHKLDAYDDVKTMMVAVRSNEDGLWYIWWRLSDIVAQWNHIGFRSRQQAEAMITCAHVLEDAGYDLEDAAVVLAEMGRSTNEWRGKVIGSGQRQQDAWFGLDRKKS